MSDGAFDDIRSHLDLLEWLILHPGAEARAYGWFEWRQDTPQISGGGAYAYVRHRDGREIYVDARGKKPYLGDLIYCEIKAKWPDDPYVSVAHGRCKRRKIG